MHFGLLGKLVSYCLVFVGRAVPRARTPMSVRPIRKQRETPFSSDVNRVCLYPGPLIAVKQVNEEESGDGEKKNTGSRLLLFIIIIQRARVETKREAKKKYKSFFSQNRYERRNITKGKCFHSPCFEYYSVPSRLLSIRMPVHL